MKNLIFLFALVSLAVNSSAQINASTDLRNTIRVEGTAQIEVTPDEIYVNLVLEEHIKDKKKISLDEIERRTMNYLKQMNIEPSAIQMENIDARILAARRKQGAEELLTKTIQVKFATTKQVEKIFSDMDSLWIKNGFVARYSHSKMEEYKIQIKKDAIKAAKNKADYLMQEIGQKAGKAVYVHENSGLVSIYDESRAYRGNNFAFQSNSFYSGGVNEEFGAEGFDFGQKKIKLNYSIVAYFSIE
jgi:uncharacterized protein YggE